MKRRKGSRGASINARRAAWGSGVAPRAWRCWVRPSGSRDQWDDANALLNKALRYDSRNQRASALKPLLLIKRHDYATALALAEQNRRIPASRLSEPGVIANLSGLAWCHIALRNLVTAHHYVDQLLERYPATHSGWTRLGMLCLVTRRYDDAISHLRKAIDMAGVYAMADTELVEALVQAGQISNATMYVEHSLAINPKNPPLLAGWGDILLATGQTKEAIEKYRKSLELLPTLAEARDGWARALALSGDIAAATSQFERAIINAPKWSAPYLHWGNMLANQGDYPEAIAKFRKATDLDPKWAEPYAAWGGVLERTHDLDGAQEKYRIANSLDLADLSRPTAEPVVTSTASRESLSSLTPARDLRRQA